MSIAMERRDFLQQIDCFVCNQQEAGILFSDEYDHMGPEEMCRTLAANVGSARIPCMVVTMGTKARCMPARMAKVALYPPKGKRDRYHRRRRCVLCRYGHWPRLWQNDGGSLRHWQPAGCFGHLHRRKCLPAVPPAGVRAGCSGCGLSAVSAGRSQPPDSSGVGWDPGLAGIGGRAVSP